MVDTGMNEQSVHFCKGNLFAKATYMWREGFIASKCISSIQHNFFDPLIVLSLFHLN
jgi:hypothetical protein